MEEHADLETAMAYYQLDDAEAVLPPLAVRSTVGLEPRTITGSFCMDSEMTVPSLSGRRCGSSF